MFLATREKLFARRAIKRLLKSHSTVSAEKPGLSGEALYREVLLHARQADPAQVDEILRQAEDSVDEWTAPGRNALGFREVVHFVVMLQYKATGHEGAVVSFGKIVNSLIPEEL